ncbi:GntR family transcriptional regulator [Ruania alkalisoli]|uniref:GntR family transcriptional regulator n=1 Tax=Ruania alkalisoli TaxID=2779775 RepID=A0A7M1SQT8_9MICO|nr:GntR family transcriptional regulator [Ruania alkalisoli]QOR69364.1 GntR family transcriptional regulator [Ruania alkalisoli]
MDVRTETYQWVKSYIASLPRDQGTFLNEAEIAKEAGASRTPVREAFMRLQSEGLLERIPHRGAYVPPLPDSEIRAVMQARSMIETWAVDTLLTGAKPVPLDELDELLERQVGLWSAPVQFIELDREFHSRIVAAAGNAVIDQFYGELRDRQLRMGVYAVSSTEDRAARVVEEHRQIVDQLRTGDATGARAATDDHLQNTLEAMLG